MAGLNTPSPDLAVAHLWGRIIRPLGKLRPKGGFSGGNSAPSLGLAPWRNLEKILGADNPARPESPAKTPPPLWGLRLGDEQEGRIICPPEGRIIRPGRKVRPIFRPPFWGLRLLGQREGRIIRPWWSRIIRPQRQSSELQHFNTH